MFWRVVYEQWVFFSWLLSHSEFCDPKNTCIVGIRNSNSGYGNYFHFEFVYDSLFNKTDRWNKIVIN